MAKRADPFEPIILPPPPPPPPPSPGVRNPHPGQGCASTEDVRAENRRLHAEVRGLNGQIEGLTRVMAGMRSRLDRTLAENEELKARLRGADA